MAYAGFFRFDELSDLRPVDLKFDKDMVTVRIKKSKNDQLRKGDEVVIARTKNATCPVGMMERYMSMGNIDPQDSQLLFRRITHSKFGEKLRVAGGLSFPGCGSSYERSYGSWITLPLYLVHIAYVLVVLLQRLMLVFQTTSSSDMNVGILKEPKTDMLKIPWIITFLCPGSWECELRVGPYA